MRPYEDSAYFCRDCNTPYNEYVDAERCCNFKSYRTYIKLNTILEEYGDTTLAEEVKNLFIEFINGGMYKDKKWAESTELYKYKYKCGFDFGYNEFYEFYFNSEKEKLLNPSENKSL